MNIRQPNPTQAAGILRKFLSDSGIEIKHTAALEALARVSGFTDWQAMAASQKKTENAEQLLLVPDEDGEGGYTFVPQGQRTRVWVRVGNVSVYFGPSDEGVAVDLFAAGAEDGESLATTYLLYQEALADLCENVGVDIEDVAAWFELTGGNFEELLFEQKSKLVRDFSKAPGPKISL